MSEESGRLRIAQLRPGEGAGIAHRRSGPVGLIGVTHCPGRNLRGREVDGWNRDLDADLDAIRDFGSAALVSLMQADEMERYGVPVERVDSGVRERGMKWYHLPIVDMQAPDSRFDSQWKQVGAQLREFLDAERNVVVHCLGGMGRAGTVAARILVEYGEQPQIAIERVREVRRGAIQTAEQEMYVLRCMLFAGGAGALR